MCCPHPKLPQMSQPPNQHPLPGSGPVGLGFCALAQCGEGSVPSHMSALVYIQVLLAPPTPVPCGLGAVPSALQVLCVFMKLRAQLQRWPPLVLLQSCEQVPKRRHSLMSGGYTGVGGSWRVWVSARPLRVPPSYPGIRAGLARCGSPSGRRSRRLSRCARSGPHPRRCWRWWRSWSAWGLRGTERVPCPEPPWAGASVLCPRGAPPTPAPQPSAGLTDAAVLLVRAVPAVVQHVAAQRGGQAALVPAQELLLVFAVGGLGRGGLWGGRGLQI